jgi:hypothetical protein
MNTLAEPITEQQKRLPVTELSAEAAEQIALAARAEFATTAEAEGRRAALQQFNRRVSHWANQFTDKRLRRFAWTLGTQMRGETHSFHVTEEKLQTEHQKLHPGAYVDAATGKPRELRGRTIRRYVARLEEAGIITVERDRRQDEGGDNPGARRANVYTVHFGRVLRHSAVCAHDFRAEGNGSVNENVPKLVPENVPEFVPRDVPPTCSKTGSETSSSYRSSSPLRGAEHDDEVAEKSSKEFREGSSARADGGTAQEDSSSAGNREDAQPSSAAPPGGGAPAAAPGPASRAERELDQLDGLAQDLARIGGSQFKPHLLAPRFRQVARDLDVSADMVDQAVAWWADGYACAAGFKAWDDVANPGGYLHQVLPDLVLAYLDAREAKAAELGKVSATFYLLGWLRDHKDQDVPA